MKIYKDIKDFNGVKNPIVTSGTFDGVHTGHRKIISRLNYLAKKYSGETVLLTFSPHPRSVLFPDDNNLKLINTLDEKKILLEKSGIQHLIIQKFTRSFSRIPSINFVRDVLINQINTFKLVIGYNHQFGRNREGSFSSLKELAPVYGFEVEEISAELINDVSISSTKIRNAILEGNIKIANNYLGYNYSISGVVVKGRELGRKIGYPTANIKISNQNKIIPKDGVYAVSVNIEGEFYSGMVNIGYNPTIGLAKRTIEVNIFNFQRDIYGRDISLIFFERLRDEIKFSDIESLKAQLIIDKNKSIKILRDEQKIYWYY